MMKRAVAALAAGAVLAIGACGSSADGVDTSPITTYGRPIIHLPSVPPGAHIAVQAHLGRNLVTTALRFKASLGRQTAPYSRWYPWHGDPIQLTWAQLWPRGQVPKS